MLKLSFSFRAILLNDLLCILCSNTPLHMTIFLAPVPLNYWILCLVRWSSSGFCFYKQTFIDLFFWTFWLIGCMSYYSQHNSLKLFFIFHARLLNDLPCILCSNVSGTCAIELFCFRRVAPLSRSYPLFFSLNINFYILAQFKCLP